MKPTACIETSVVSYLSARPSRDVVVAAYQQVTRDWWRIASDRFDLVASALVVAEAGAGDAQAAQDRLRALETVTLVEATADAERVAQRPIDNAAVPLQAADDAAHIAVTNGVNFLVTWNFRHIANAAIRTRIERTCREAGYEPPVISPNELLETDDGNDAP